MSILEQAYAIAAAVSQCSIWILLTSLLASLIVSGLSISQIFVVKCGKENKEKLRFMLPTEFPGSGTVGYNSSNIHEN